MRDRFVQPVLNILLDLEIDRGNTVGVGEDRTRRQWWIAQQEPSCALVSVLKSDLAWPLGSSGLRP
jgi:hypothetical protein